MTNPYLTLSSRIAYDNRWLRLREDVIRLPDGSESLYGVVERCDFVVVVPVQDGCVTLVEQYRYPVRARLWEFPMGTWEHAPETAPEVLAGAELREETGWIADRLVYAGEILQGPGYCTQRGHVFLATQLLRGETARELSEQDMISREFPLAELEAMIRSGTIRDAMTVSAFGLLRVKGLL